MIDAQIATKVAKKDVVHLVTSLAFGGIESHMHSIAVHQACQSVIHRFCAIAGGGAAAEHISATGSDVTLLGCGARIPSVAAILALARYLRRVRPDILHCHGAEANFHGLIAGFLARVPVRIAEEVGIPSHSVAAKHVFALLYRSAACVIAVSDAVRSWLVDNGEASEKRVKTIHSPVAPVPQLPLSPPSNCLRIAFVGRLEPVKNPLALVEAVAELVRDDMPVELWIIGDGSQQPQVQQAIEANGLRQISRMWGFQPDPIALLRQCTLFVQPSLSEGFSLGLIEAMACQMPVIASRVGGAAEVIEDGTTGWLVDPDPKSIAAALRHAWHIGAAARKEVGERARWVAARFNPQAYLQALEKLYAALIVQRI